MFDALESGLVFEADAPAAASASVRAIREEVRQSLRSATPWLSSRFFYDARGARLFEKICTLPEYYPTRCELEILQNHLPQIAAGLGPGVEIVEPGSGEGIKTRCLLEALDAPCIYRPIDVASGQLKQAADRLQARFPRLSVEPVCGDFTQDFPLPKVCAGVRRVFYFPGSTVGNFVAQRAQKLLANWRAQAGHDGLLLIGVDLRKEPALLQAAYDDAQGVTAEFNRNILRHINTRIGSDFQWASWRHEASYDEISGQVQMHLRSACDQYVHLGDGSGIEFAAGDAIRTEYSCKYTVEEFQQLARRAGWRASSVWLDRRRWFSVQLFRAA